MQAAAQLIRLFSTKNSLLDRAPDRAKMLPERDTCVRSSGCEVLIEASLLPESGAKLHPRRLVTFGVADTACNLGNSLSVVKWHKQNAIVITQHEVICGNDILAESC
jgi:hypothetical protein